MTPTATLDRLGWTLHSQSLPPGVLGQVDFARREVTISPRLRQVERRCTTMHELVHVERGPAPADPHLRAREEATVERETARRLIPLSALAEALSWSLHPAVVADELRVTEAVLTTRLRALHPAELHYLTRRLARVGRTP